VVEDFRIAVVEVIRKSLFLRCIVPPHSLAPSHLDYMKKEVMVMNLGLKVEEMERAHRATGISSTAVLNGSGVKPVVPNPEFPEKAVRRSYMADYKRHILGDVIVKLKGNYIAYLLEAGTPRKKEVKAS